MMHTRNELGRFFEQHNKKGIGAEVGVQRGYFSYILSQDWTGKILAIDIWTDGSHHEEAKKVLQDRNVELIKGDSVSVATTIADGSLDWVYIDADHDYESVYADLVAWYPKVRKGGVVAGHDYINYTNIPWNPSNFRVREAVDNFFDAEKKEVTEIPDDWFAYNGNVFRFPSWYLIK